MKGLLRILLLSASLATGLPFGSIGFAEEPRTRDNVQDTLNVKDFGAVGDGTTDDTRAFIQACAKRKKVIAAAKAYKFIGEIPLVSGCSFEFTGNPLIEFDLNGENGRGFWFGPGVENAAILGRAVINAYAQKTGSDGSRNGVFSLGGDFYSTTDPLPTRNNRITGEFLVRSTGTANIKAVQIIGYVEDTLIEGITAKGQMNFAFSAHWAGNGRPEGLPTKTWHPHRILFRNDYAINEAGTGSLQRGFSASGAGKVTFDDTHAIDVKTLGFNIFVGDYGFSYAQNLKNSDAFNIEIRNSSAEGTATALSADGISSRVNGSPYWTGPQHEARLDITGFLAKMKAGTDAIDVGISGLAHLNASRLRIIEEADGNTKQAMYLTSIREARVQGEIVAKGGALVRDCGAVDYLMNTRRIVETPDVRSYNLAVSASSMDTTVSAAVNAGDTSMTLSSASQVTGPGGIVRYNDGRQNYEMDILSMTYAGGVQSLEISPAPVSLPKGSAITVIQTVKRLTVGPVILSGARSLALLTGTVNAKPRNITFKKTQFLRSGFADIEATHVAGLDIEGTLHDQGGQTTTSSNKSAILIGAGAEDFHINGARFGNNNSRLPYLIHIDKAAKNGIIEHNTFESLDSTIPKAAAILKGSTSNILIAPDNTTKAGVKLISQ